MVAGFLRTTFAAIVALLALTIGVIAPAAAAAPPAGAMPPSTDMILKWINDYRHRPDPERLPMVVKALSALQTFKDF